MDYGPIIQDAIQKAAQQFEEPDRFWKLHAASVKRAEAFVSDIRKKGPIGPQQAIAINDVLPTWFQASKPPVTYYSATATESGGASRGASSANATVSASYAQYGPGAAQLPLNVRQGLTAWYWCCLQLAGSSAAPSSAVFIVLFQTLIHGSTGASAWSLVVGFVDPASQKWISIPTLYLSDDQVKVTATGVVFNVPAVVQGQLSIGAAGFAVSVGYAQASVGSGFSVQAAVTSVRGPTYEQPAANMSIEGGIVQNAYWSIVDGSIMPSSCTLAPFGAASFLYSYNAGWGWLDNEQIGMQHLPSTDRFLAALAPTPALDIKGTKWLWTAIQATQFQMDASVVGAANIAKLVKEAGTPGGFVAGSGNVWVPGVAKPYYNVPCQIRIDAMYANTTVPSAITVSMPTLSSISSTFPTTISLTSRVPNVPQFEVSGAVFYESPASTNIPTQSGSAIPGGVIEWNTGTPSIDTLAAIGGFSASKASELSSPSAATIGILCAFIILTLVLIALIVSVIVWAVKGRQAFAGRQGPRTRTSPTPTSASTVPQGRAGSPSLGALTSSPASPAAGVGLSATSLGGDTKSATAAEARSTVGGRLRQLLPVTIKALRP
jgi:hypothetical protein